MTMFLYALVPLLIALLVLRQARGVGKDDGKRWNVNGDRRPPQSE